MKLEERLRDLELQYGGLVKNVISKYTDQDLGIANESERMSSVCQGGDRFSGPGYYSKVYAENIKKYISKDINIFEIGILNGTGLAVWDSIFTNKNSKIFGGDIDINNCLENFSHIKDLGGYSCIDSINTDLKDALNNRLSCFKYDQYNPENIRIIESIIKKEKFDIVIDDGDHQDKPNIMTAQALKPFLKNGSTYFLEDVKPHRVKGLVEQFEILGYTLIDNTCYLDGRIGGLLVFEYRFAEK